MSKRRLIYKKNRRTSELEKELDEDNYKPLRMSISPHLFVSKKDLLAQNVVPSCPVVPPKLRRCIARCGLNTDSQAKLLTFCPEQEAQLSSWYCNRNEPYFDQVFYRKFKIGEGSYGCVYKAICKDDDKLYAVKHFNSNHPKSTKYKEVENMEKIGFHENILRFYMAWEEGENVFIKMEYCQMSLAQYSKINHNISESQLHEILHDIVNALVYIHSKNYVHMDVKPDNILMDRGHYKLGDFGLLYSINVSTDQCERLSSEGDSKYLAPELLAGIYTTKADIFALGVTMLELATDFIMPSNGCLWHAIRAGGMPGNLPEKISFKLISLIREMMAYESVERPDAIFIYNYSICTGVMAKDAVAPRTDYAKLVAMGSPSHPNIINPDIRRVLNDIADSPGDMFQTPVNYGISRKIAFSPGGDGIPRRMNSKNGASSNKEYRRSPRMKLFL